MEATRIGRRGSALQERIQGIAERIAGSEGIEVVDVEWLGGGRQRLLRVFLDKPAGITHGDCEGVSRQLSAMLDAEAVIPDEISYTLEVSSPGWERRLVKRQDFERFAGRRVRLQVRPRPGEARRRYSGVLEGWVADRIRVRLPENGEMREFAAEEVERATLAAPE
ncbi:MAG: ribosome maturation factor RimP [Terriglobales bacterium]